MTDAFDELDDDVEFPRPGADLYGSIGGIFADLSKLSFGALGYELGYRHAADVLYEHMTTVGSLRDALVFPFAFLWRQSIELQLKRLIVRTSLLRRDDFDEKSLLKRTHHHNLCTLWETAKEQLIAGAVYDESNLPVVGQIEFERIILQLASLDPSAAGFRFYQNRDGSQSLKTPTETLDIVNLHRVLRDAHGFVECANMEIDYRLDLQAEVDSMYD